MPGAWVGAEKVVERREEDLLRRSKILLRHAVPKRFEQPAERAVVCRRQQAEEVVVIVVEAEAVDVRDRRRGDSRGEKQKVEARTTVRAGTIASSRRLHRGGQGVCLRGRPLSRCAELQRQNEIMATREPLG